MDRLPILPLGQLVVYPHVVLPMALNDPYAVQLIDDVLTKRDDATITRVKAEVRELTDQFPLYAAPRAAVASHGR